MKVLVPVLAVLCSASQPVLIPVSRAVCPASISLHLPLSKAGKELKACDAWLKAYNNGRIDKIWERLKSSSIGVKFGVIPKAAARSLNHAQEIERICKAVAKLDNAAAAKRLLRVAAVGLNPKSKLTPSMNPNQVRSIGEEFLRDISAAEAMAYIVSVAKGEELTKDVGARAAALRRLGIAKKEVYRPVLVAALSSELTIVRLGAVDGIYRSKLATAMPALSQAIEKETLEPVLSLLIDTQFLLIQANNSEVKQKVLSDATTAVVGAIGRSTWRVDIAAVKFLERVRNAAAVPALIEILMRFDTGAETAENKMSGVLRHRAYDALVSLSGATFPMDKPKAWVDWWTTAKGEFKVPEMPKRSHVKTSTGDFFGIPVRGRNVLFVVDTSGSMDTRFRGNSGSSTKGSVRRIDIAKRELIKAVNGLIPDGQFNLVQFGAKAKMWQKRLVKATPKNKKKFAKMVEGLRPDGGTNIWAGLAEGLKIKTLAVGERYKVNVDEVFILSDGLPSFGEVIRPKEIIRMMRDTNQFSKVKINTIYIGGETKQEREYAKTLGMSGEELMRSLAEQSGGKYINGKDLK